MKKIITFLSCFFLSVLVIVYLFFYYNSFDHKIKQDYNYFWTTLEESSVDIQLIKNNGLDVDEVYEYYKNELEYVESYDEFYSDVLLEINYLFYKYGAWHTGVVTNVHYDFFMNLYGPLVEMYENEDYSKYDEVSLANSYDISKYMVDLLNDSSFYQYNKTEVIEKEHITFSIIEEESIALLTITQMIYDAERDRELVEWLDSIKNYPYLIIDIRGNTGGFPLTYSSIISKLSPTFKNVLFTYLINDFEYNKEYNKIKFPKEIQVIDDFDKYDKVSTYRNSVDSRLQIITTYPKNNQNNGMNDDYNGFGGEIYLLVDENVYSAADTLTYLFKEMELAKIVGSENTSGGTGQGNMNLFILPNSRVAVYFASCFILNRDGTNNSEVGISPDIDVPKNVDELEFIVDFIRD